MTIQDIICFLNLAKTLNYTKTAEELYISQPAVTRHIKSLEDEIGAQLFDRSVKKNIQLTQIGQILYQGMKSCEDIYSETMKAIELHTQKSTILINLLRGTTFPDSYVEATTTFMRENEGFTHFANFVDYSSFKTVLDRGEMVICSEELVPKEKHYDIMKLTREPVPYYIVASKKHKAFKNSKNVQLEDIAATSLFLPKMLPKNLRETMGTALTGLLGKSPKEIIYLDSSDSVSLFLRSNECFTISTGWHTDVSSSDFRTIQLPLFTDYYAVWQPSMLNNPIAMKYVKALRDC